MQATPQHELEKKRDEDGSPWQCYNEADGASTWKKNNLFSAVVPKKVTWLQFNKLEVTGIRNTLTACSQRQQVVL